MKREFYQVLLASTLFGSCSDSRFSGDASTQSTTKSEEAKPADSIQDRGASVPLPSETVSVPEAAAPEVPEGDTSVEFGATEVFHIGDGAIGVQSACVNEVTTFDLSGTTYFFEFEVAEDDTSLDLSIGKICGIDAVGMTTVSLVNEVGTETELSEVILETDNVADRSSPFVPYPTFSLNKGLYSVVITSKNVLGKPKPPAGTPVGADGSDEYDDFIVGNIFLKADKPVRASRIYAE